MQQKDDSSSQKKINQKMALHAFLVDCFEIDFSPKKSRYSLHDIKEEFMDKDEFSEVLTMDNIDSALFYILEQAKNFPDEDSQIAYMHSAYRKIETGNTFIIA